MSLPHRVPQHRAQAVRRTAQGSRYGWLPPTPPARPQPATALDAAHALHPERFPNGAPQGALPPASVHINPLEALVVSIGDVAVANTNTPPDPAAQRAPHSAAKPPQPQHFLHRLNVSAVSRALTNSGDANARGQLRTARCHHRFNRVARRDKHRLRRHVRDQLRKRPCQAR
jgi:hypothetical protein